jgi:hypothetical protein
VKTLLKRVSSNNSVSVHIRRGDYVSNPHASKFHGTKGLDYYEKAVERIAETVKNPELFVISDDIEWCKENLRLPYKTTHIDGNAGFEDMHIMSHCAHNIIANSSFSWWAAWLNTNPDKVVIAPKKWFNDESINTEDVVPKTWIRL